MPMQKPIPTTPLIVTGAFRGAISAPRVAAALDRGLRAGGVPPPDVLALPSDLRLDGGLRARLDEFELDKRMRAARAVIIGEPVLDEQTLAGSAAFEVATRARQSGVPCYAVTGENRLSAFDARLLDLQVILTARSPRGLTSAGLRLASVI
jgi:glycerate kinase